jgi:hypothetical protein
VKIKDILDLLLSKIDPAEHSYYSAIKLHRKDINTPENENHDANVTKEFSNFVLFVLKSKKEIKIKNVTLSLKSMFLEFLEAMIDKFKSRMNNNFGSIIGLV